MSLRADFKIIRGVWWCKGDAALRIADYCSRNAGNHSGAVPIGNVSGYGRSGLPRVCESSEDQGATGFAAGLSMVLSIGDIGVIASLADWETAKLLLTMYRLMGVSGMESAAGAALCRCRRHSEREGLPIQSAYPGNVPAI
ncbi:MAG: hypothetical protein OXE85_09915 [Roseovarius sp.]|nr:hypothetical protein [Roseovarius sp.]